MDREQVVVGPTPIAGDGRRRVISRGYSMSCNMIARRTLIGVGAMTVILLLPLVVVLALGGLLFGVIVSFGFVAAMAVVPLMNYIQRVVRRRVARSVVASAPRTRRIAADLNVPLVESVSPPEMPLEVIVRSSEGVCPLMRVPGDVIDISPDGKLSSPLCSPSAAAVQRLLRTKGLESGSTAHCVCPIGLYELTFMLEAA